MPVRRRPLFSSSSPAAAPVCSRMATSQLSTLKILPNLYATDAPRAPSRSMGGSLINGLHARARAAPGALSLSLSLFTFFPTRRHVCASVAVERLRVRRFANLCLCRCALPSSVVPPRLPLFRRKNQNSVNNDFSGSIWLAGGRQREKTGMYRDCQKYVCYRLRELAPADKCGQESRSCNFTGKNVAIPVDYIRTALPMVSGRAKEKREKRTYWTIPHPSSCFSPFCEFHILEGRPRRDSRVR